MAWKLFTDSEIATILHGLRIIQDLRESPHGGCLDGCCDHFDDAPALTSSEIDVLCERINLDGVAFDVGHDACGDQGLPVDAKILAEQGPIVASIEAAEKEPPQSTTGEVETPIQRATRWMEPAD